MSAPLTPFFITGNSKGLQTNKKPFLLPDQAWSTLENAYVFRERELKREGNKILGRLQRNLTSQALGTTTTATTYTFNDVFTTLSLRASEPNAQFASATVVITVAAPDAATFTDQGNGTFVVTGIGDSSGSYIDYATGKIVIVLTGPVSSGAAITASFGYYPSLPGMAIWQQDQTQINTQNTIWWDTKYAYIYSGASFSEFIPGTTWTGTNSQFFWAYNYQGASGTRLLFVTNFNINDPMYYTDGLTWTAFTPAITASINLYQARVLIPYFGRLVALNTYEGTSTGSAVNYFNRCRFSGPANASPITSDAWRSDLFGLGGSIDAPVQEQITGATFVKNTLVVDFEYSTWQLRYVGEYGLPFIWERVSADFGSGSTFSGVLFDNERLNVGDVAITTANAVGVDRIDLDIPDQVFDFQNNQTNKGSVRVWGIRNYQKELVYWNYPDSNDQAASGVNLTFPNKVLLFNYRNKTWAIFRDNVTCFGTFQIQAEVDWNSQDVTWDSETVTWDDPINQVGFPQIVKLNQQGFAHLFAAQTIDDVSLVITAVALSSGLLQLTIPNHNLMSGETIYIGTMQFIDSTTFVPVSTSLNNKLYSIEAVINENTIQIAFYDTSLSTPKAVTVGINPGDHTFTPDLSSSIYIGTGYVALIPRPNLITKDINLYQQKGMQTKLSRIDFLMEPQPNNTAVTVNLILNSAPSLSANISLTPTNFSILNGTTQNPGDAIDYLWFSFFQTLSAQYFRIQLTYSEALMNQITTHESDLTLYAINAWTRPGGRLTSGGS